jgi:hypothetical protein
VAAVGGDFEAALASGADAVQLHELLNPLLAHAHASGQQLLPDARKLSDLGLAGQKGGLTPRSLIKFCQVRCSSLMAYRLIRHPGNLSCTTALFSRPAIVKAWVRGFHWSADFVMTPDICTQSTRMPSISSRPAPPGACFQPGPYKSRSSLKLPLRHRSLIRRLDSACLIKSMIYYFSCPSSSKFTNFVANTLV